MGPSADQPSGVGTPDSGWQTPGRRGRATAALSSTIPADTTAGTTAGRQHGKRAPPAAPDLGGMQTPQPPTPGQPGYEPFDPQQTDPQPTASAARLEAIMEKQTETIAEAMTTALNGLTGMLQQLLERQAQPMGAPADLRTPSPWQSPPGTAPTAPQATALPPPPAAALAPPPPSPTSSAAAPFLSTLRPPPPPTPTPPPPPTPTPRRRRHRRRRHPRQPPPSTPYTRPPA